MMQSIFPLLIFTLLAICCMAFLLRRQAPRWTYAVGWVSGLLASIVFIAMVTVDAFQPGLTGLARELAMPPPLPREGGYWAGYWFHVAIGLVGVAYCLYRLGSARTYLGQEEHAFRSIGK